MSECRNIEFPNLHDAEFMSDGQKVMGKLKRIRNGGLSERFYHILLGIFKKFPLRKQVLFISIRKDGKLEGNAKALYPHIKGKKTVCAKMLPHSFWQKIKMNYHIFTSRVIVTDDYLRYLQNQPLRESQRVIQLWHACGAFKKFGQYGSNMSVAMDHASHVQYNLVTVSSEPVREIYADAFDIDIGKVQALGCPRTDCFFDKEWIQGLKKRIYAEYQDWHGREIILYAPTFRDTDRGRSSFCPKLDFERLSEELLPEQIFIVCPHPVMTKKIVPGEFHNIREVRNFSTNELMFVSDMLITDYSSVIFEYVLLDKPIIFFCYDLEEYDRDFYIHYPDDLPGEVYKTQEELMEFLCGENRHRRSEKYGEFLEHYMSACDGHSCERIAEVINLY